MNSGRRRVADARIDATQRVEKGAILAQAHRRDAARLPPGAHRHREIRTAVLIVARPGIGGVGVDQRRDLVELARIGAFARVVLVQRGWDAARVLRVHVGDPGSCVRTLRDRLEAGRNPTRIGNAVGVGAKQHAIASGVRGGVLHRQAPRPPGARTRGRQFDVRRIHGKRQRRRERRDARRGVVDAVVEQ